MKKWKIMAVTIAMTCSTFSAYAVTTDNGTKAHDSSNALQLVIAAIRLVKVSDLDFGTAPQNDPSKLVAPAAGAGFTLSGEPSKAYSITLPADGTIFMTTGAGGDADHKIAVDTFTSDATLAIDASGSGALKVGATRAAIRDTQASGSYSGAFQVEVAYN